MLLTSGYSDYVSDKALITGKTRGLRHHDIVHPSLQLKVWANIGMICFILLKIHSQYWETLSLQRREE